MNKNIDDIKIYLNSNSIDWAFGVSLYNQFRLSKFEKNEVLSVILEKLILRMLSIKPNFSLDLLYSSEKNNFADFYFNELDIKNIYNKSFKSIIIKDEKILINEKKEILEAKIKLYTKEILNKAYFNESDFINVVDRILSKTKLPKIDIFDSTVFTFGSCFAVNFAKILNELNYKVHSNLIAENVNSTINNYHLLEYIILNKKIELINELNFSEDMKEDFMNNLSNSTHIIYTLGTTLYLKDFKTNLPTIFSVNSKENSFLTYSEHVHYLIEIIKLLKNINPKAKLILSVSPVPIRGLKGDYCIIQADTFSKSILRSSINELTNLFDDVYYLPTFEIFRSLAIHSNFALFGFDDRNPRHIRGDMLSAVINKILYYM
jgi:hypothetical protein